MTIARPQTTQNLGSDSGSGATFNAATDWAAGSAVIVAMSSSGLPSSVTIGGIAATLDNSEMSGGNLDVVSIWRIDSAPGGRNDVVLGTNCQFVLLAIYEVTGLTPGGPETSGAATGSGGNPNCTASAPAAADDSFVLGCWVEGSGGGSGGSLAAGYTIDYTGAVWVETGAGASKVALVSGTQSITFTNTSNTDWACIIASYAAAPAPADPPALFMGNPTLLF